MSVHIGACRIFAPALEMDRKKFDPWYKRGKIRVEGMKNSLSSVDFNQFFIMHYVFYQIFDGDVSI